MANKIFLDTNIVFDLLESSRKNHQNALQLMRYLIDNSWEIYISEDMLSTIYYVAKDKRKVLLFIEKVILTDWNVVHFGESVIKNATKFALENDCDLEDALQCFCAKECECRIFLTSDKKFIDCGIEILDYNGFLNG